MITAQRIRVAAAITSKKRLLEVLAELLTSAHPQLCDAGIFERLIERERLGSTGIGHGVALPHARVAELPQEIGAFVQLREPIPFNAIDDQPVDLAFALLAPDDDSDQHVRQLASLAMLFSDAERRTLLRRTTNPDTLLTLLTCEPLL